MRLSMPATTNMCIIPATPHLRYDPHEASDTPRVTGGLNREYSYTLQRDPCSEQFTPPTHSLPRPSFAQRAADPTAAPARPAAAPTRSTPQRLARAPPAAQSRHGPVRQRLLGLRVGAGAGADVGGVPRRLPRFRPEGHGLLSRRGRGPLAGYGAAQAGRGGHAIRRGSFAGLRTACAWAGTGGRHSAVGCSRRLHALRTGTTLALKRSRSVGF